MLARRISVSMLPRSFFTSIGFFQKSMIVDRLLQELHDAQHELLQSLPVARPAHRRRSKASCIT